jgi:hypothetical protein
MQAQKKVIADFGAAFPHIPAEDAEAFTSYDFRSFQWNFRPIRRATARENLSKVLSLSSPVMGSALPSEPGKQLSPEERSERSQ